MVFSLEAMAEPAKMAMTAKRAVVNCILMVGWVVGFWILEKGGKGQFGGWERKGRLGVRWWDLEV